MEKTFVEVSCANSYIARSLVDRYRPRINISKIFAGTELVYASFKNMEYKPPEGLQCYGEELDRIIQVKLPLKTHNKLGKPKPYHCF